MHKPARVLLGSPSSGTEYAAHKQSIFRLVGACNPDLIYVVPRDCEGSNICMNQNALARQAVEQGFDYLLLAETDVAFPNHALARLLSHGKPIIGCSTPWKERDLLAARLNGEDRAPRYMGHETTDEEITMASLIEGDPVRKVHFIPMGLTLISTEAIRAISDYRRAHALPEGVRQNAEGKWVPVFSHVETYPGDTDEGVCSTTDSAFCSDARAAGFDIWLDARLSLFVEHIGSCNYVAPEWMRQKAAEEEMAAKGRAA